MTRFKVSAEWMKACGMGTEAQIYPVVSRDGEWRNNAYSRFVILDKDGFKWTVSEARGTFVTI